MSESLRGQFLIAGKRLRDANFFKAVVLVVEHNTEGAMGLVVNRPSSVTVSHALSEHFPLPETDDLVFLGGPVEPAALFILHDSPDFDEQEPPVAGGLYVGSSAEVFESIVRSSANGELSLHFRIFSGCAGWAPGQLEGELERGDWYIRPAVPRTVFGEDPYCIWDTLLEELQHANRVLPESPGNVEWN
jgi:putative transcriptional regulator